MKQEQDFDSLRLHIVSNILELQKRDAACGAINTAFMNIGFESSNTFKALISKIAKTQLGDVAKTLNEAKKVTDELLYKNVAFNNKRVFFYGLSNDVLNRLFKALTEKNEYFDYNSENNKFNYEMIDHDRVETSLIIDKDEDFKIIYLRSGRNRTETRHPKNKEHLFADDEYGEVIDVIIKVQYVMNAFDFFAFDFKNNHLIIGLDLDDVFPTAETNKAQGNYIRDLTKLGHLQSTKAENLRNCVAHLEHEKEGRVLNHSFMTADRGFNHAGNSITSNQDIRNDDFHKDGISGKDADFYGIKKLFPLNNDEKAILTVRMTYKEYKKANARINSAVIDSVTSYEGLKFSIRKILQHNHN